MKEFLILLLLVIVTTSSPVFEPLSDAHIFYINNVLNTTWKAGRNARTQTLDQVKKMGVNMEANHAMNRIHLKRKHINMIDGLPTNFDARQKWPHCPSIGDIPDQGACSSGWAFAVAGAMSDRICIGGGGNVTLSAEDLLSCCNDCGFGCDNGYPPSAFDYYINTGVVTGGHYGTNQTCRPYSIPHCDHYIKNKYPKCGFNVLVPKCNKSCIVGYPKTFQQDKHFGKNRYRLSGVTDIMTEIYTKGPVTAAFVVYEDFPLYKSGVYAHKKAVPLTGQAVKLLGWGVESGVDYWLAANSWNTDWGDKGFFKILRGKDECGIEDEVVAGEPKL